MAPGHTGEFWVGCTAQCSPIADGLAMGSLQICIKSIGRYCAACYLLPDPPAVSIYPCPLGSEFSECSNDSRSSTDDTVK